MNFKCAAKLVTHLITNIQSHYVVPFRVLKIVAVKNARCRQQNGMRGRVLKKVRERSHCFDIALGIAGYRAKHDALPADHRLGVVRKFFRVEDD